jgi:hypothetical protein
MVISDEPGTCFPAKENAFEENIGVGCISAYAWLCCCGCCLGKCGKYAPKEW